MTFTPFSFRPWLMVLALACPLWALAGDVHYNQMDIQRDGRDKLVFSMSLNVTLLLHQVLAPQTPLADFLKLHSELSDKALQAAIDKASKPVIEGRHIFGQRHLALPLLAGAVAARYSAPLRRGPRSPRRATPWAARAGRRPGSPPRAGNRRPRRKAAMTTPWP